MIKLGVHFQDSNTSKGTRAELKVAAHLRKLGYKVSVLRHAGYDLLITDKVTGETKRIEVKFSSQNNDGKYRATTRKAGKYGHTDHMKSDYIVFVCQPPKTGGKCTSFIIPSYIQGEKTFLCVTSNPVTYNGKLSSYKERWDILAA